MYRTSLPNQITASFQNKLSKFDICHHPSTRTSFKQHMQLFEEQIHSFRCKHCWLRNYDCYCSHLNLRKESYSSQLNTIHEKVKILIYYHYLEIGRSANTAHLFEIFSPKGSSKLVFGDSEKEIDLFQKMKEDYDSGNHSYCVLYPTSSSMSLQQWINQRTAYSGSSNSCSNRSNDINNDNNITTSSKKTITMIALDGTYSQAMRQFKHLKKSAALFRFPLPVVKLDLGDNGCKSAITGIMIQPEKDKICTYQAIILALQQLGLNDILYTNLRNELDLWLEHILKRSIRRGKVTIKKPNGLVDREETVPVQTQVKSQAEINSSIVSRNETNRLNDHLEERSYMTNIHNDPKDVVTDILEYVTLKPSLHESTHETVIRNIEIKPTKKFGVYDFVDDVSRYK